MRILTIVLGHEYDVVLVRQRTRQVAALLAFDMQDQTRLATAVSEIAHNAVTYAGGGTVEFAIEGHSAPQVLHIRISDQGPGIANLQRILDGQYTSATGRGLGLLEARRLVDQCAIQTSPQGTTVTLQKLLPPRAPAVVAERLTQIADTLAQQRPQSPLEEVQLQNQELLHALVALRQNQEDLRRANALQSRFLSHLSHELRVPINTILSLSRLLLERVDGDLTGEQDKQVSFIRQAAENLSELVNDLLDLAKIEAGKALVRPTECAVAGLFSMLQGMLRPLVRHPAVELIFEAPEAVPRLVTDEGKLSHILRNLIANGLKYTERGEVRVSARLTLDGQAVRFAVADTGIGIAPEDQERIFEEFIQLEHPLQRHVPGTGLGLPLCKRLAALLGGSIEVASTPGVGSTFAVVIPLHDQPHAELPTPVEAQAQAGTTEAFGGYTE